MKKILFFLTLVMMVSCQKEFLEADALGSNSGIVGTWVEEGYEGDVLFMNRSDQLDPSKYGFIIEDDGTFIERKNTGWDAAPALALDNFEGSWEAVSDSLLNITVAYWGGTMTYQIRIVSLDEEQLSIRYLYAEDRANAR